MKLPTITLLASLFIGCQSSSAPIIKKEVTSMQAQGFCTKEYMPICATVQIQCLTTPCEATQTTFSNRCMMKQNKQATFLHQGKCKK